MFITLEGMEGSGKGTLLKALREETERRGLPLLLTREPGGSELGKELRALLLSAERKPVPAAELFLFLADRAQHAATVIRPALEAGKVVISDRYADSTIVYQGFGRGMPVEELYRLNETAVQGLWPDITLLLDLSPEEGLRRARARNKAEGIEASEGRFEAETLEFHRKVREGYREWAARHPRRFHVLDASQTPEAVAAAALSVLLPFFDKLRPPACRLCRRT